MLSALPACVQPQLRAAEPRSDDPPALSSSQLLEVARELERRGDSLRAEQYYVLALERGAPADQVLPRLLAAYVRDRRIVAASARGLLRRTTQRALRLSWRRYTKRS